jgi:D-alanine-D-alanine ligase
MKENRYNILVLAGGESTEREVSLTSAKAVVEGLTRKGQHVRVLDTRDGQHLMYRVGQFDGGPSEVRFEQYAVVAEKPSARQAAQEMFRLATTGIDVVFNALHGGVGENGTIQAVLDLIQMPYTGSPMAASAMAMNKDISKRVMRTLGIATADWQRFDSTAELTPEDIAEIVIESNLGWPVVVKPTNGGSTVGLTLVESADGLPEAIRQAFAIDDSLLVEKYLKGREITIAVLDGKALPPVEIKPSHALYDYTCKYTKGKSKYFCPADIDADLTRRFSFEAELLYKTIGCRGYARVDFITAPDGSSICLELNTLPGMTGLSLFPMAARAAGIEFDELLIRLCELALKGK